MRELLECSGDELVGDLAVPGLDIGFDPYLSRAACGQELIPIFAARPSAKDIDAEGAQRARQLRRGDVARAFTVRVGRVVVEAQQRGSECQRARQPLRPARALR